MNSLIESLNGWGGRFFDFALPSLWQSSLLIAVVFAVDFLLRRRMRPAIRYLLWFVVFIKLLVPPTLALPTGAAWWLRTRETLVVAPPTRIVTVSYDQPAATFVPVETTIVPYVPPPPQLSRDAWILVASMSVSAFLAAWAVFRWRQISRRVQQTTAATGEIQDRFVKIRERAGLGRKVQLRLTAESMSPAVCGLFRPIVLLPQSLIEKLTSNQLRAVLLHELIHLRRRDVWVNCAQTLLQIFYWWHPLLWFANARIRRVREEAVDDAVMFALNEEAEIYAPTLLEVAKLAFNRPLATLGLVGILESRNALRHRIERLLNFSAPRRVGVSVGSVICIAAFTALAVPMGEPPARISRATEISQDGAPGGFGIGSSRQNITSNAGTGRVTSRNTLQVADEGLREQNLPGGERTLTPTILTGNGSVPLTGQLPTPRVRQVLIEAQFYLIRPDDFAKLNLDSARVHRDDNASPWWNLPPGELSEVQQRIKNLGVENLSSPRVQTSDGVPANLSIGDGTNDIELECVPYVRAGRVDVTTLARTTGKFAPDGKPWPDIAGHTNCAIFSKLEIPDGYGTVLRAEHAGTTTANELIVLLKAKILEPRSQDKVPFLGDLPGVGRLFRSGTNDATMDLKSASAAWAAGTGTPDATNLHSFSFHIGREAVDHLLAKFAVEHDMQGATNSALIMKKFLENAGVDLKPPKSLYLESANGYLTLHADQEDLQKTAAALGLNSDSNPLTAGQLLQEGKSLYRLGRYDEAQAKLNAILEAEPDNQGALYYLSLIKQAKIRGVVDQRNIRRNDQSPFPNLYARTNAIYTSPERQRIYEKLNTIRFDKVTFKRLALEEVIRNLAEMTQRRDSDQKGINFFLNRSKPMAAADTNNAAKTPATAGEDVDLAAVTISLDPGLKDVRLLDVLEAITKSADHPIKYSLLDYGIEFSLKGAEVPQLHTRTFKVDMNTFFKRLKGVAGFTNEIDSGDPQNVQSGILAFFKSVGVDLQAPKSIFFNGRQGTLTVHSTDDDLELVEQLINTLNITPPEVTIKVRFVEADEKFLMFLSTNSIGSWTNSSMRGILTEPALAPILKALRKEDHATLLSEGEVTTLSGRQAKFEVVDVKTVASGIDATVRGDGTNYNYVMTNMNFGTTLDVSPSVAADGYTIQMTLTPSVTEFLGYENPKQYSKYDPTLKRATLPLPKYRSRQVTTSAQVWDGQTLMLGMRDESVVVQPDGSTLRQPFNDKKKKQLIIFITPTIIDPSGNRVHSKDYYDNPALLSRHGD